MMPNLHALAWVIVSLGLIAALLYIHWRRSMHGRVSKMIEVYRMRLAKADLSKLEPSQRNALLLLGHASNQLTVLLKTLHFSLNNDVGDEVQQSVAAGQSQILLRLLVGLVFETWDMLRERIIEAALFERYQESLSELGRDVHDELKSHFEQSSLIIQIRNNLSYHYPNDKVLNRAFEDTPEDEPWDWYLTEQIANSFYFLSDLVMTHAVIRFSGEQDAISAHKKFVEEVSKVSNLLIEFIMQFMVAIITKDLPHVLKEKDLVTKVTSAPNADTFVLPFYAVM
jgi:hypothetical protein